MRIIPLTNDPSSILEVILNEQLYDFEIQFNLRANVWTLAISQNGTPIIDSVNIVLGTDLLLPYNLELGSLFAVDLTSSGSDATVSDLGTRVVLVHMTTIELEEDLGVETV